MKTMLFFLCLFSFSVVMAQNDKLLTRQDVIGRMGNTGANSTGAHAHMSVNGRGDLFAEKFNQPLYKNSFQTDDYALYMSVYENKSFSDNLQLWSNVKKFSEARPDLLDFDDFKKQHLEDVPLIYK